MGTSISTTKTHLRIQQKRQQRNQDRYGKKAPNTEQFFPLQQREPNKQSDLNKKPQSEKVNNFEIHTLQKYSIHLKHQQSNPQEKKETEEKNNDNKKFIVPKKQSLKESNISDQKVLTITNKQPQFQINSQASIQQITFSSKNIKKSLQNENQMKPENSVKAELRLQTPMSQQDNPRLIKHEPVNLNPQFNQFADKQLSERDKKRKEQAIKYIKDSQFLGGKAKLSNNPYQIGNKLTRKVDQLLPSKSLAIDLSPKTQSINQTSEGQTIKLKTEQYEVDYTKVSQSMTLNKKNKNNHSLNTVNKKN